jgi:malate synthase
MADGVMVVPTRLPHADEILTAPALAFVAELHRRFAGARADALNRRVTRRADIARAGRLTFDPDTAEIRDADWAAARTPVDMLDRRVEISTAPLGARMIAALNAGAQVWVADFGAMTPVWSSVLAGQQNVRDALLGTVSFTHPDGTVDRVRLDAVLPTVTVRPRDWLLPERNITIDGEPASAALVDFGLYAFHNAIAQFAGGSSAYFCLPLDGWHEARLWAEILIAAEELLGLPLGSLRATALIQSLPAAVEMDEILHELRAHALGLALDVEGYLFSFIECLPDEVLPAELFGAPFIRSLTAQLVRISHRRSAHAIGPITSEYRQLADAGFDGAQVADRYVVSACAQAFNEVLGERPNQISRLRYDVVPDAAALTDRADLADVDVLVTHADVNDNIDALPRYFAAWLADEVSELDANTAELGRAQVWQWVRGRVPMPDTGQLLTPDLVRMSLDEHAFEHDRYELARLLVEQLCLEPEFRPSAALLAYDLID